jgi:hypothetical protein
MQKETRKTRAPGYGSFPKAVPEGDLHQLLFSGRQMKRIIPDAAKSR